MFFWFVDFYSKRPVQVTHRCGVSGVNILRCLSDVSYRVPVLLALVIRHSYCQLLLRFVSGTMLNKRPGRVVLMSNRIIKFYRVGHRVLIHNPQRAPLTAVTERELIRTPTSPVFVIFCSSH